MIIEAAQGYPTQICLYINMTKQKYLQCCRNWPLVSAEWGLYCAYEWNINITHIWHFSKVIHNRKISNIKHFKLYPAVFFLEAYISHSWLFPRLILICPFISIFLKLQPARFLFYRILLCSVVDFITQQAAQADRYAGAEVKSGDYAFVVDVDVWK